VKRKNKEYFREKKINQTKIKEKMIETNLYKFEEFLIVKN